MANKQNKASNGHAKKDKKFHLPAMPRGKAAVTTMAGVAGAVVGAGAAVAATQMLSDKKNREKVKKTFDKVRHQVMDVIEKEQKRLKDDAKTRVGKTLSSGKNRSRSRSSKSEGAIPMQGA